MARLPLVSEAGLRAGSAGTLVPGVWAPGRPEGWSEGCPRPSGHCPRMRMAFTRPLTSELQTQGNEVFWAD